MANTDEEQVVELVEEALRNGRVCLRLGHYGRAFAHFLLVAKLSPCKRSEIIDDFALACREHSDQLINTGRLDDLFCCYSQACEAFADSAQLLNNIGAQLFRLGYMEEAAQYVRKAVKLNPDFSAARENFENICGFVVERWHFRMLNDIGRNKAYQEAIKGAIKRGGTSVLDIGAGTGLLSMMAVTAGAERVYACERSKTMYNIACEVLVRNRMSEKIKLLQKSSTDLCLPEDIPQRVSVVVTEIFDAGLFGEHVLSTLHHAWENLLINTSSSKGKNCCEATVIPHGAQVYVCAIQCDFISKQNRCKLPSLGVIDFSSVEILCDTGNVPYEPYTTEELLFIKGGYKQLSDVIQLLHVDFCDPQRISELLSGVTETLDCEVRRSGRVDALAVWFDLHLDQSVSISSSPSNENCWHQAVYPVFPHHISQGLDDDEEVCVKEGDSLTLQCVCKNDKLTVECIALNRSTNITDSHNVAKLVSKSLSHNTEAENIYPKNTSGSSNSDRISTVSFAGENCLTKAGSAQQYFHKNCVPGKGSCCPPDLSQECRSNYGCSQEQCSHKSCSFEQRPKGKISSESCAMEKHLQEGNHKEKRLKAENLQQQGSKESSSSANFSDSVRADRKIQRKPQYFLPRTKIGALNDTVYNRAVCESLKLFYTAQREQLALSATNTNLTLLDYSHGLSPFGLYGFHLGFDQLVVLFTSLHEDDDGEAQKNILLTVMRRNGLDKGNVSFLENFTSERREDEKVHCVLVELVEPSGMLCQQVLENLSLLRITTLVSNGIILPAGVSVYGVLIESHDLHRTSIVDDKRMLGYHISDTINDFKMTTHIDIELSTLNHRRLSEPVKLLDLSFNVPQSSPERGECSDVPDFLTAKNEINVHVTQPGVLTAVVYWFDIHLCDTVHFSTDNPQSHFKQAAVMMSEDTVLDKDDVVVLSTRLDNSCIRIVPSVTRPQL